MVNKPDDYSINNYDHITDQCELANLNHESYDRTVTQKPRVAGHETNQYIINKDWILIRVTWHVTNEHMNTKIQLVNETIVCNCFITNDKIQ